MQSVISSKGQITVPRAIREQLGLSPGTRVWFEVVDGAVLMRKGDRERHPVDRLYGSLALDGPGDELVDAMRGPRPRPR
jgi:antitoxin PrlF